MRSGDYATTCSPPHAGRGSSPYYIVAEKGCETTVAQHHRGSPPHYSETTRYYVPSAALDENMLQQRALQLQGLQ